MGEETIPMLYLGVTHSIGTGEVKRDGTHTFKPLGDFGKPFPIIRSRDATKYLWFDSPEYNPKTGKRTGVFRRIIFLDLENYEEFSFKNATPMQLKIIFETMNTKLMAYENSFEELLKIINDYSVDDFTKRRLLDSIEHARKLTNNFGGQNQIPNK
jgi:hypothetical protein